MRSFQGKTSEIKIETTNSRAAKDFDALKPKLENRPLVLYGAARLGGASLFICRERGIKVAAFCDQVATGKYEGIEIIDPETLKARFFDAIVVICSQAYCDEIYGVLRQFGFPAERIITPWNALQPSDARLNGLKYRSCSMIENFALHFPGRIDMGGQCLALCCEGIEDVPGIAFCESARDSMEKFRRMRAEVIAESVRLELLGDADEPRKFTAGCVKCANFQAGDFGRSDGLIHFINLSTYPAPCQCKCVYCVVRRDKENMRLHKRLHADCYEKLFDTIDYAESAGHISPDATWQVASGEITIHPYKNRILDRVKNRAAIFFTNGFIFDEKIAHILSENPLSAINLSIDSGTPETWRRIKGVDNFDAVIGNLLKYRDHSRPGQISLKYIVLPGINDTLADYGSVIEIMNALDVRRLEISRDAPTKYTLAPKEHETLMSAAGTLAAMVLKNRMLFILPMYSPPDQKRVIALARELLQAGAV